MTPTAKDSRSGWSVTTSATVLSDTASPLLLAHAARWELTLAPTTHDLSLVRYRTRGDASWPWSPWVTATGVTPAAGATGTIAVDGGCGWELDVECTASGGTANVALYVVGT
jgi:hypothetical protein